MCCRRYTQQVGAKHKNGIEPDVKRSNPDKKVSAMTTKRNENADHDYLVYDWNAYCAAIANLHLPRFAEIPDIPLYMDQLIGFVGKQMELFALPTEKPLTSSMVNNVKQT